MVFFPKEKVPYSTGTFFYTPFPYLESVTQQTPFPHPHTRTDRKTKIINPSAVLPNSKVLGDCRNFLEINVLLGNFNFSRFLQE